MTCASRLHKRDEKKREEFGWSPLAFIKPELPVPRTDTEKVTRKMFEEWWAQRHKDGGPLQIHIYDVIELMETAYAQGLDDGAHT